jgi:hypothetical protein
MTVPINKMDKAIMSINSGGTKSPGTLILNPLRSRNARFTSTSIFASRKKITGIGGRPIICCFLIIALTTTAVIMIINNKEIIKIIVEIIMLDY